MVSFVIYFHSTRVDNLRQMIRLLLSNEGEWLETAELILVCQDGIPAEAVPRFAKVKFFNLGRDTYNKPLMCNFGVRESAGTIIALLDSDRILPPGYFQRESQSLLRGTALAPRCLMSLEGYCDDEAIRAGRFTARGDFRCPDNGSRRKNIFSGNTLIWRDDYLASGGMDESFEGYGFADNDMVRTFRKAGFADRLNDALELHLNHQPMIQMGTLLPRHDFRAYTLRNGLRYHRKWGLKPDQDLWNLYAEISAAPPNTPAAREVWLETKRELGRLI